MADGLSERWGFAREQGERAPAESNTALPAEREASLSSHGESAGLPAEIQYCSYCEAQLLPKFYFCVRCAQPYKNIEALLTPLRPRQLTDGERVDAMAPNVRPVFWGYFTVVLLVGLLTLIFFNGEESLGILLAFSSAAVAVTTIIYSLIYWKSLLVQLRVFGFNNRYAWMGLAALPVLLLVNYGYHKLLIDVSGLEPPSLLQIRELIGVGPAIFFVAVLPGIMEEIAFRGMVQHWLQVALRPRNAILLASCLFVVLHFSIISAPYLLLVGLLLGWTKYKTGSLYPSMLIHFLHNFLVLEFFRF